MKRQSARPGASAAPAAAAPPKEAPPIASVQAGVRVLARGRTVWAASAAVFLGVTGLVAATAGDLGLTWDEPAYEHSEQRMAAWFRKLAACRSLDQAKPLFAKDALLDSWVYNRYGPNFHPPLAGMLCNLTHAMLEPLMDDLAARRMASGIELALACAVLFMFLARRYGYWPGGVAAASLALVPRVFGHAHIAGTDTPLLAFWAFTALAFWNGLTSRVWRIAFGVLLGLSLLVKFSALLIVLPLGIWLVAYRAIPHVRERTRFIGAAVATAFIAWPLVLAAGEIVRLAGAIRHATQQEAMLRPVVGATTGKSLEQYFGHEPPFTEEELKRAALERLAERVQQRAGTPLEALVGHAAPFDTADLKGALRELGGERAPERALLLDDYIPYVQVKDLGVTSRLPGWILFLPLLLWLVWSVVASLPFAPTWMTGAGAGLGLWLSGLAVGPAVAVALNPTWWHETLAQLAHYYQISVGRHGALPDIEIFYLGKKYIYSLPWHNAWVLMAVTVPTAILGLALVGLVRAVWHDRRDALRVFFLLNLLAFPVSRMLPTPAHDGVRLMLPTFFFLAAFAGWGFELIERLVERFRAEEYSTAPVLAVVAAPLLLPAAYWLFRTHPYELSYYNGLVGGLRGAHRLGFEPTYWYDAVTPQVLRDLNDPNHGLPPGAVLGLPDPKINPDVFPALQEMGKLRSDIQFDPAKTPGFPYVPLLTHSSKATPYTRLMYALKPQLACEHSGVRLFSVYDPVGVSRAWALWLLLDRTDYSKPRIAPHADREMIARASRNYRALVAAAMRVAREGVDQALEHEEDADAREVIERLAERRSTVELLLSRRRGALQEAAEIINRAAEKRPELLVRIIEYEGYLSSDELGDYLDEGLPPMTDERQETRDERRDTRDERQETKAFSSSPCSSGTRVHLSSIASRVASLV